MRPIPEGQLCQSKQEWGFTPTDDPNVSTWGPLPVEGCPHRATVRWGDLHEFNHGGGQFWCEHCALDAQIAFIEERMKLLDDLKTKRLTACEEKA